MQKQRRNRRRNAHLPRKKLRRYVPANPAVVFQPIILSSRLSFPCSFLFFPFSVLRSPFSFCCLLSPPSFFHNPRPPCTPASRDPRYSTPTPFAPPSPRPVYFFLLFLLLCCSFSSQSQSPSRSGYRYPSLLHSYCFAQSPFRLRKSLHQAVLFILFNFCVASSHKTVYP